MKRRRRRKVLILGVPGLVVALIAGGVALALTGGAGGGEARSAGPRLRLGTVPRVMPAPIVGEPYQYSFCQPTTVTGRCGAPDGVLDPSGGRGQFYTFFTVTTLPLGLSLDPYSGVLTGTMVNPNYLGPLTVCVRDAERGPGPASKPGCDYGWFDPALAPPRNPSDWRNATHTSRLEQQASRIASRIAGRTVAVQCLIDTEWTAAAQQSDIRDWAAGVASLAARRTDIRDEYCAALSSYSLQAHKPTQCSAGNPPSPEPCYPKYTQRESVDWSAYDNYAFSIKLLAHEAVHLRANRDLRDRAVEEAIAECRAMQWIPFVAEQLGARPDDAQSIALYVWEKQYPRVKTRAPDYWSSECRPGGALDIRPAGKTTWP